MPEWLVWVLSGSGLTGLTVGIGKLMYKLHADAVQAQRERANDNRARAEASEKRNSVLERQIYILLGGDVDRGGGEQP